MTDEFTIKYINPRNDGLIAKVRKGEFPNEAEVIIEFFNGKNERIHTVECEFKRLFDVLDGHQDW